MKEQFKLLDIVILDTYPLMIMQFQKFNIRMKGQRMFQYLKLRKVSLMKRLKQKNLTIRNQQVQILQSQKFMKNHHTLNLQVLFQTRLLKQRSLTIRNQQVQTLQSQQFMRNPNIQHQLAAIQLNQRFIKNQNILNLQVLFQTRLLKQRSLTIRNQQVQTLQNQKYNQRCRKLL